MSMIQCLQNQVFGNIYNFVYKCTPCSLHTPVILLLSWYWVYYYTLNTLKHGVYILISIDVLPSPLVVLSDFLNVGLVLGHPVVNRCFYVFWALNRNRTQSCPSASCSKGG